MKRNCALIASLILILSLLSGCNSTRTTVASASSLASLAETQAAAVTPSPSPTTVLTPSLTPSPSPALSPTPTMAPTLAPTPIPSTAPKKLTAREAAAQKAMGNYTDDTVVVFADKQMEAWIRTNYIKTKGDITVRDMKTITYFNYGIGNVKASKVITTLFDLRYCTNLEAVDVFRQPLVNIEGLRGLQFLNRVYLCNCNITDLSPLADKESLTSVWIGGNSISDASPVLSLPNLRDFNGSGTNITDISALRNTTSLNSFYCLNKLKDYSPLFGHVNLDTVGLSGISNKDFVAMLGELKCLRNIWIENSSIQDSSLILLKDYAINNLTFDNCGLTDISGLSFLTYANDLRLTHNRIKDISPLAGLTQVAYCLDIRYNNIKDYSPLKNINIYHLWINPSAKDKVFAQLEKKGCVIIRSN